MIVPGLSGGGGILGLNLEGFLSFNALPLGGVVGGFGFAVPYISDFGLGVYRYQTPSGDTPTFGFSSGGSVTGNIALGTGPYTGLFSSFEGNIGPVAVGWFGSGLTIQPPLFVGGSFGLSEGAPFGAAGTVSDYTALFEFRLGQTLANVLNELEDYLNFSLKPGAFPVG